MDILSLGEKIKRLRKEKDMTLKELAGDRITAAQISHIERDKSHTSYELLEYLSNRLNVSIDYLLETKEMQSKKITDNLILQSELYVKCNELDKAHEKINEIMNICEKYNVCDSYGKYEFLLGMINLKRGKYTKAINEFEKSLYHFIKVNDSESIFKCYMNIGYIYMKDQFYKGALSRFDLAEEMLEKSSLEKTNYYKELYSKMAYCYMKINDTVNCLDYIQRIDKIDLNNNFKEEAEILYLKAKGLFNVGKYEESKDYFKKALKILEKEENKTGMAKVYLMISEMHNKLGNRNKVLEYSSKVYELKRDSEDKYMMDALFRIIDIHIKNNELETARRYCKVALASAIKHKDKMSEYKVLRFYATMHRIQNQIDVAIDYLDKCIEIVKGIDEKKIMADLYIDLGDLYSEISKEKELEYYQKGTMIYRNIESI